MPQIVLPVSGLFVLHRDGKSDFADPTRAVVFGSEESYQVSHPSDAGDECVVLEFNAELHDEAIGTHRRDIGRASPQTQLGARALIGDLIRSDGDPIGGEEDALLLLEALAGDLTGSPHIQTRVSRTQRDRANQVRALLADSLARRWTLEAIGRAVQCSPFHLARQFRRATGETISRYLLRLRLATAVHRIAEGETDLAGLAVELGFSHHSHFTAQFRSVYGCTPGRARSAVISPSFGALRTIMTADLDRSGLLSSP